MSPRWSLAIRILYVLSDKDYRTTNHSLITKWRYVPTDNRKRTMSPKSAEEPPSASIQLDTMSLEELNQLKQQEEGRLQALTAHFSNLRQVHAKLTSGRTAVQELQGQTEGKEMMLPLTESVYVPGRVKDPSKLMVELGTGYYVEKSPKGTLAYLDRKMRLVGHNSDNIATVIQGTRKNLEAITMTMQGKMLEIRARQEGRAHQLAEESKQ